jgi:hypothetical protein
VVMFCHWNGGQNHSFVIANESFENMVKFRHLVMTVTNQNCIRGESKSRLNSGNVCYNLFQFRVFYCAVTSQKT